VDRDNSPPFDVNLVPTPSVPATECSAQRPDDFLTVVQNGPNMLSMTENLLQNERFVRALLSKLERERAHNLDGLRDDDRQME
jgi:hypothetical protein